MYSINNNFNFFSIFTIKKSGQSPNQLQQSYRCSLDEQDLPKKKLVCFYRVEDEYRPYDLDPCLCTHIVYSYVAVKENFAFIAGKKGKWKPSNVFH